MAEGNTARASAATTTTSSRSDSHRPSRSRKKTDPFNHIPQLSPSPASNPNDQDQHHGDEEEQDSLFRKMIMGPLIFTSFLVSLLIVDRRDRAYRVRQHPAAASSSFWTRINPVNWIDPEPYQDPVETTWQTDGTSGSGDGAANPVTDDQPRNAGARWFRRKKHRRMAKYEFEDAFALRESVAAWMLGAGLLVVGGSAYFVRSWFGWFAGP